VLSDQEAVDLLRQAKRDGVPNGDLARMLVDESLKRNSTDNITALVVDL
jgi:serine/threonine protein phosphatase PrpC